VLDVIDAEGLLENCAARGEQLKWGLQEANVPGVTAVRGLGLLVGVMFEAPSAGAVVRGLIARGFLATEAGPRTVRLSPPLTIRPEEVDALVRAFPAAVEEAG
jgi:acetylornithine/succinyldiaminopimelate/putrescine aminotransferase